MLTTTTNQNNQIIQSNSSLSFFNIPKNA